MIGPFPPEEHRQPRLDRAMPADNDPAAEHFPEDTQAEVQLRDGSWVWCNVRAQRKDKHGRWCIEIRYYVSSSFGEGGGWYRFDRRYLRRLD
jgi:hypothetical protein